MNARSMFQRVLTGWASDVLALRRRGWDRPCVRLNSSGAAIPARRTRREVGRRRAA